MSKLHHCVYLYWSSDLGFVLRTACTRTFAQEEIGRARYTNDPRALELLPQSIVCQNCMKAYRAQHAPAGKRGRDEAKK